MLDHGAANDPIRRPLVGTFWKVEDEQWEPYPTEIAKELKRRSFFSRFEVCDLEKFVPKMTANRHEVNSVIFPDEQIFIILEGMVETKRHIFGKRVPVPCNIYRAGCVLGFDEGDKGVTSNIETWSVCKS